MAKTFDDIAAEQGWNADSREQVLRDFIDGGYTDLDDYALKRAFEENEDTSGMQPPNPTLPEFRMDVVGEYQGNAYPEPREYRVTMTREDSLQFFVEDAGGYIVSEPLTLDDDLVEGITWMAHTEHGLSGYEDDWRIPSGMNRVLTWVLPTQADHYVRLDESQIEQVAAWLDYATGESTYEGDPENWEY
jgi:hypothetical protein